MSQQKYVFTKAKAIAIAIAIAIAKEMYLLTKSWSFYTIFYRG